MPVKISFWIAFLSLLIFPSLFPCVHLCFFAPFLSLCFYHHSIFKVWVRAIGCGLITDLFSSGVHFGLTPLNYFLVTFLLYSQQRHFFKEHLSTLPLMTAFFSLLSSLFLMLTSSLAQHSIFNWHVILSDLLTIPMANALYALLLFSFPFYLFRKMRRMLRRYR